MKIATLAILTATAFTAAAPAAAQMGGPGAGPTLEITPFAGGTFFASELAFDTGLDGAAAYGAHLGLRLSPRFGIEGTFAYAPTEFEGAAGVLDAGDTDVFIYGGGLNLYAPIYDARFSPFLSVGAGAKTYDFAAGDSETDFMGYVGPGLVVPLSPAIGLRIEARDYISKYDPESALADSEWQHDVLVAAGLTLRLR